MTNKDEALKLALEALEAAKEELIAYHEAAEGEDYNSPALNNAITAIREALAEQPACEHEWLRGECLKCGQSIEQPAPVAKPHEQLITGLDVYLDPSDGLKPKLYSPQPAQQQCEYCKRGLKAGVCYCKPHEQQEPVAICEYCEKERPVIQAEGKPWAGLTDEEIEQCMKQAYATVQGRNLEQAFARAIEAKLKEKNHG